MHNLSHEPRLISRLFKRDTFKEGEPTMDESVPVQPFDTTQYGSGPDDSISDVTEKAAVTQHSITIPSGETISYTARVVIS